MNINLKSIGTENKNLNTRDIDLLKTEEILIKINEEDKKIANCVETEIPNISLLVDAVYESLLNGGRLIYVGAGTSGRVGILDAVECRPTYGVSSELVMCLMAGGKDAFVEAVEGAEDNKELAINDLMNINLTEKDFVIGIAASGRTPYVISAVEYAKKLSAKTGCITTCKNSLLASLVDYKIEAVTGQEVITGSTRMKSGTAQKMITNMISTTVMIKLGKVYGNYMIDLLATNEKLVARQLSIISEVTGLSLEEAKQSLQNFKTVKKVLIHHFTGKNNDEIDCSLKNNHGNIRLAIQELNHE